MLWWHFYSPDLYEIWSLRFESSVISYGSEAIFDVSKSSRLFESSVISYGSEAYLMLSRLCILFESSVISYGSEARFVFM